MLTKNMHLLRGIPGTDTKERAKLCLGALLLLLLLTCLDAYLVTHHSSLLFTNAEPSQLVAENWGRLLRFRFTVLVVLDLILAGVVWALLSPGIDYPKFFFLLILLLGLVYMFVITPFSVPDEFKLYKASQEHLRNLQETLNPRFSGLAVFSRAQSLVRRHNTASGWVYLLDNFFAPPVYRVSGKVEVLSGFSTASYPLMFAPQVLGLGTAYLLRLNYLQTFYLARLMNLLLYAVCVAAALRKSPRFQLSLGLAAAVPMALQQAASFSYDAFINGMSFFLIACLLKACTGSGPLPRRELLQITLLTVLLAPAKSVYLALLLLFLAIPAERFRSRGHKLALFLLIGCSAAAFILLTELSSLTRILSHAPTEKATLTLAEILSHPLHSFSLIRNALNAELFLWLRCMLGYQMSALTLSLPDWCPELFGLLLAFSAVKVAGEEDKVLPRHFSAISFLTAACVLFGSLFALMLVYSDRQSPMVLGFQGRYLLPVLPLLLLLFHNRLLCLRKNVGKPVLLLFSLLSARVLLYIMDFTLLS